MIEVMLVLIWLTLIYHGWQSRRIAVRAANVHTNHFSAILNNLNVMRERKETR